MAVLSDWDTTGLEVLFAAEIESGRSDQNGGTSLYTRTSGGGGRVATGSIIAGSLAYDGVSDFDRFMYLATPVLRWNDFTAGADITAWHAANADALLYLTVDVGGVPTTYSSTQTVISGGTAWFNFNATAEFWSAVSDIVQGTHFVVGMARGISHLIDAGDLSWTFGLPEPSVTKTGSHFVNAGDLAWAFALPEPSVSVLRAHVVNAGDLAWAFALPEPQVSVTRAHVVDAGDLSWTFALPEPSVTKMGSHFVNAGDLAWAFALPEPRVSVLRAHVVDAGDVAWTFDLPEPRVTLVKTADAGDLAWSFDLPEPRVSLSRSVAAGSVNWIFGLPEPSVSVTRAHVVDAGDVAWTVDLPEPHVRLSGPISADPGDITWLFAIPSPRVALHQRLTSNARGARRRMTMRANTERDVPTGAEDTFGQAVTTLTPVLTRHPCYWQAQTERFIADGSKVVALGTHFALMPLGTDVEEQDRFTEVTDRRGRPKNPDKLRVIAVVPREDHVEVSMESYT